MLAPLLALWHDRSEHSPEANSSVAFSFLDRDKDGRVSFAEIHGLLRAEVPSFQEAELAPVLTSILHGHDVEPPLGDFSEHELLQVFAHVVDVLGKLPDDAEDLSGVLAASYDGAGAVHLHQMERFREYRPPTADTWDCSAATLVVPG